MLKMIGIAAAAASLLVATSALGGPYAEQFNSGNAGWQAPTVDNGGGVALPNATFLPTGGYSGGYVSAALTQGPNRLFGFQPADAHLFQGLTGLTLTTDYKISGAVTGPDNAMVRFYIGSYTGGINYFVSDNLFSWDPNADTQWATHQVDLVAANFLEWPNQASHSKTFDQVVATPDDLGLVFCGGFTSNSTLGFTGSGSIAIDNFGAGNNRSTTSVPEPAAIALLATGGVWLLAWRRRSNR
jgi:hypothetical protein